MGVEIWLTVNSMTTCSKAEFARQQGVSKVSVTKWEKKGWLVISEGKVEVEASIERLKKYRDTTDGRANASAKTTPADVVNPVNQVNSAVNSSDEPIRPPGWPFPQSLPHPDDETPAQAAERILMQMGGADMSMEEARRVKENYLALLNKLEYEQKGGQLIGLDLARTVLFEGFRKVRDAWMNWPSKFAPLIAADLGLEADRVTEVLTGYVHKQIASLGEPEGAFVKD